MDQKDLRNQRIFVRFGILALLALAFAGCGRKGPLELPSATAPTPALDAAEQRILPTTDSPGLIQPPTKFVDKPTSEKLDQAARNPSKPINAPGPDTGKPFFLDPLL